MHEQLNLGCLALEKWWVSNLDVARGPGGGLEGADLVCHGLESETLETLVLMQGTSLETHLIDGMEEHSHGVVQGLQRWLCGWCVCIHGGLSGCLWRCSRSSALLGRSTPKVNEISIGVRKVHCSETKRKGIGGYKDASARCGSEKPEWSGGQGKIKMSR